MPKKLQTSIIKIYSKLPIILIINNKSKIVMTEKRGTPKGIFRCIRIKDNKNNAAEEYPI